MYYVCIENDQVTSVLSYAPNAPETVIVIEISDLDYEKLSLGTHYFDISERRIVARSIENRDVTNLVSDNQRNREFLASTDWKVLRHIREKALGLTSSLSEEEYLSLEQQRQLIASKIR